MRIHALRQTAARAGLGFLNWQGPIKGLVEMGPKRILFSDVNQLTVKHHPIISASKHFSPYADMIEQTFLLLSGLAGLRVPSQSRVNISPILFEDSSSFSPAGYAFSEQWLQVSIGIHQACINPDPLRYLSKCGYSRMAKEYFLSQIPSEIQDILKMQKKGKGIGNEVLANFAFTAELTHAVHLLLENRLGLQNFIQETSASSEFLIPTRTRYVLAELAEHIILGLWYDPLQIAHLSSNSILENMPPSLTEVNQELATLPWAVPNPCDFDFGDFFLKDLLGITLQENAHALAGTLAAELTEKLSYWYLSGLVRNDSQILGILRLWFLYALFSYPQRTDVLKDSSTALMIRATDLKLLILNIYELSIYPAESLIASVDLPDARVASVIKLWLDHYQEELKFQVKRLLAEYEILVGSGKAQEIKTLLKHQQKTRDNDSICQAIQEAKDQVNSTNIMSLQQICFEMSLVNTPFDLVRLVLDKISRIKSLSSNHSGDDIEALIRTVQSETFGEGRNYENPVFASMMAAWRNGQVPSDNLKWEHYLNVHPWTQTFKAATRLNALPNEVDVPSFPLTQPA